MTIDEAIARERKMVEIYRNNIVQKENYHNMPWIDKNNEESMRNVEEHKQLAEWLEELKSYRASVFSGDMTQKMLKEQYNKAIDDFTEKIIRYVDCGHLCSPTEIRWSDLAVVEMVKKIAEQLKAGDEE